MTKQLKNVNHHFIRYANCWEDADILLQALQITAGDRVLSIASAGDNSFSLLLENPDLVVAVDINTAQLNLVNLKKAAFKTLEYADFLAFLGFSPCNDRWFLYTKVAEELSPEGKSYWKYFRKEIEDGIIYQGKFEKYFSKFRKKILPLIHSTHKIDELLSTKNGLQQKAFFAKQWNTWRWRALFKFFFSRFIMGRLGRDPKFLKEVNFSVSSFILKKAREHLSTVQAQQNYFLHFILKGKFGTTLPHYARKENFSRIKVNIDNLVVLNGFAEDAFKAYTGFNKFNLSNIFEYMHRDVFQSVSQNLIDNGVSGSRYAYWNLMVPRKIHQQFPTEIKSQPSALSNKKDNGFFYNQFLLDIKK